MPSLHATQPLFYLNPEQRRATVIPQDQGETLPLPGQPACLHVSPHLR